MVYHSEKKGIPLQDFDIAPNMAGIWRKASHIGPYRVTRSCGQSTVI